jgi:hypothetical protein
MDWHVNLGQSLFHFLWKAKPLPSRGQKRRGDRAFQVLRQATRGSRPYGGRHRRQANVTGRSPQKRHSGVLSQPSVESFHVRPRHPSWCQGCRAYSSLFTRKRSVWPCHVFADMCPNVWCDRREWCHLHPSRWSGWWRRRWGRWRHRAIDTRPRLIGHRADCPIGKRFPHDPPIHTAPPPQPVKSTLRGCFPIKISSFQRREGDKQ